MIAAIFPLQMDSDEEDAADDRADQPAVPQDRHFETTLPDSVTEATDAKLMSMSQGCTQILCACDEVRVKSTPLVAGYTCLTSRPFRTNVRFDEISWSAAAARCCHARPTSSPEHAS